MTTIVDQWIRVDDALLTDERGWHRVASAEEIAGDIDGRWRLVTVCHVVVLAAPSSLRRGLPGAGAVICPICANWKEDA